LREEITELPIFAFDVNLDYLACFTELLAEVDDQSVEKRISCRMFRHFGSCESYYYAIIILARSLVLSFRPVALP
jgi:hypothetical protein